MRPALLIVFSCCLAAAPLQVVRPILSDSEGGAALPSGFEYRPGETLFFSCRIANYRKTAEEKVHLAYSVQAFDPKGVPLVELFKNDISTDVAPQDKEWMPRISTEIAIPPLIAAGTYRIEVKAEDLVGNSKAELTVPFQVRGRRIGPSDTLTVENFQFFRGEEDTQPVEKAVYRSGDSVWTRFDITGFRYGPGNQIDVGYVVSVLDSTGKVLWTQSEPTVERGESFYPKLWVSASMSIAVQKNTHPGEYFFSLEVKDGVGNQTYATKAPFTVE
jgi:hypothetical protein